MKKVLVIVLSIVMVLGLAACGKKAETPAPAPSAPAPAAPATSSSTPAPAAPASNDPFADLDPITIIIGDTVAETEDGTKAGLAFCQDVTEKTDGKITFEYKASGQLGSGAEMTEAMSLGQLDFARLDYSYFDAYAPEAQLVFEPFLISDYEHFERILAGEGVAKVEAKMETYGIKVLDYVTAGFRCITSKDKITKLADCKNYLLRSPGTQIYLDTFNMMGFKPVVIAYNEVYNALQSGLANGCDNSVTTINDQEIYKITPYVCKLDHMMSFTEYCVNTDWWAKLPDAYKQVIEECMTARCSAQRSGHKAVQQAYYDNMAKNGATITEWDDRQELYDLFSDYWQNFADGLGGDAPALLAEIRKLK